MRSIPDYFMVACCVIMINKLLHTPTTVVINVNSGGPWFADFKGDNSRCIEGIGIIG
jgi:hypothetical protein